MRAFLFTKEMMRMKKSGFTLIELLIVMTVIAALMGALIPVGVNAVKHANATRVAENMKSLLTAAQEYVYTNHKIPKMSDLAKTILGKSNDYDIAFKYKTGTYHNVETSGNEYSSYLSPNGWGWHKSGKYTPASKITIGIYYIPNSPNATELHNIWPSISAKAIKVAYKGYHPMATVDVVKYW